MPRHGRRHSLLIYTRMLNRWWKYTLGIGILLLALTIGLAVTPIRLGQSTHLWIPTWILVISGGASGYALLLTIFLIGIRRLAYVQPYSNHLRLITPFLRMDISYRRIRTASSVEMQHLFPFMNYKGWKQKFMRSLASRTAIVLDLSGWPIQRSMLNLFLSPFFFPDKTTRLALLVPDWMECSMDMESFRSTWLDSLNPIGGSAQNDLLASISKSRK